MTDDVSEMWREHKKAQQSRRADRTPKRQRRLEDCGYEFIWLNEPYQARLTSASGKTIDYYPVHSVVKIKKPGGWITKHGWHTLLKELAK